MLEFATSDKIAHESGVKGVIYGNAGAGKTVLAATLPKPLIISAEAGLLSLSPANLARIFGPNTPGITYSIPVCKVQTITDFENALSEIRRNPAIWNAFDSLYIDSLSEIVESILAEEMNSNKDGRMAYGEMADRAIAICKQLRNMHEKNVFLSCKQGFSQDSNLKGPSSPGKVVDRELPYIFDLILQCVVSVNPETNQSVRWLRTVSDNLNYAKDRSGALDVRGESPNLSAIISKISPAVS